jgi:hypothetical protein
MLGQLGTNTISVAVSAGTGNTANDYAAITLSAGSAAWGFALGTDGLCLTIPDGDTTPGNAVVLGDWSGSAGQKWTLVHGDGATYSIVNIASGLAMSGSSVGPITQELPSPTDPAQQWTLIGSTITNCRLARADGSGYLGRTAGATASDPIVLQLDSGSSDQQAIAMALVAHPDPLALYDVTNDATGLSLGRNGESAILSGESALWRFSPRGDGSYTVTTGGSALDAGSAAPGGPVQLAVPSASASQAWNLVASTGPSVLLQHAASGLALALPAGAGDGEPVQLQSAPAGTQLWQLTSADWPAALGVVGIRNRAANICVTQSGAPAPGAATLQGTEWSNGADQHWQPPATPGTPRPLTVADNSLALTPDGTGGLTYCAPANATDWTLQAVGLGFYELRASDGSALTWDPVAKAITMTESTGAPNQQWHFVI